MRKGQLCLLKGGILITGPRRGTCPCDPYSYIYAWRYLGRIFAGQDRMILEKGHRGGIIKAGVLAPSQGTLDSDVGPNKVAVDLS